ncbi:MAG: AAA family ATPase [Dehalococcoidia bacterium]|nr:AAA family ATPase [Dehalococcoidia bacterium]
MVKRLEDRWHSPASRKRSRSGTKSPFIGRNEELTRLDVGLARSADGHGSAIFMHGHTGIGKTRLALEALVMARKRGFIVLEGRAYLPEAGLAYGPILEAFGYLQNQLEPARLTTIMSSLPDLARLFDGMGLPVISHGETPGDPALEKTRFSVAMSRLLKMLAREAPVVLFLDDLHSADPATIELFHFLSRNLRQQRALLLATWSNDASIDRNGLRPMKRSLQRAGLAEEMVILRLSPAEVETLARGILGDTAPADLLALLETRARGTPLFIEAIVEALLDSGDLAPKANGWVLNAGRAFALPERVRDLILDRLERLDPADRRILELISTSNAAMPVSVLQTASGLPDEVLFEALRRLRNQGVVAEVIHGPDIAYSITQPLIQEVALAELPEMERRRYRRATFVALSTPSDGQTDAAPAIQAQAVDTSARTIVELVDEDKALPEGLAWLLEQLGEAWERVGEGEPAVAAWSEALVLLSAGPEQAEVSDRRESSVTRIHRRLALVEWDSGHFEIANSHLRANSATLAGRSSRDVSFHGKDQEVGDLHLLRHSLSGQFRDSADPADRVLQLLSVAKQVGSPRAEAEANLVASIFSLEQGDIVASRERAERALALGESFSEGQELAISRRAHSILVLTGMRVGDHQYMRYHAERGLAMAQRPGAPPMEVVPRVRLALAAFMAGSWDQALWLSMEAITAGRRIGHLRSLADALASRALILALHGDLPEAEACIAEVRMVLASGLPQDRLVFSLVDIAETTLALERGQAERALGVARGFTRPPTSWEAAPAGVTAASKPMAMMLLAEAQVAVGDPKSALETAREISGLRPADTPYLVALAARAEGLAQQALGQRESAIGCLGRAHDAFTVLQMPFEAARCLLEQATTATLLRPAIAATAAHSSLPVFDRLGAGRYADRARGLLRGLGIVPPPTRRVRLDGGPLSTRELQVARLVAEGLTTAEIAERLVLSPRTITTHLDRIYTRLGIGSRTALIRYVTEAGLLSPENNSTPIAGLLDT